MRLSIAILVAACAATCTLAQPLEVAQAPPAIPWPAWTADGEDDAAASYRVVLPSAYPATHPENATMPLIAVVPKSGQAPFPVVVVLHYWGATDRRVERSMATRLAYRGIASVLVTLPFHLERTPAGTRSGELAIQPDPEKLRATMTQGAWDIRRAVDWIQSRKEFRHDAIGVMGTSLGSIMASLAFGLDERLGCACFVLGGADLAGLIWNSSRAVGPRDTLRRQGWTEAALREALAPVEPLTYLRPGARPSFVIGARFDSVVPPANVEKLRQGLGDPAQLWIDTGHYGGALVESGLLRAATDFFAASFAGRPYAPPGRLYAPTLRFGVTAAGERGVQVGLGLDVWRARADGGGPFASALLTPRGPQLFVGAEVSKGLSLGITILPKRTTWGAFWNFVL